MFGDCSEMRFLGENPRFFFKAVSHWCVDTDGHRRFMELNERSYLYRCIIEVGMDKSLDGFFFIAVQTCSLIYQFSYEVNGSVSWLLFRPIQLSTVNQKSVDRFIFMEYSLEDHGISPSTTSLPSKWWLQVHRGGHSPGLVVQLWRFQSLHRGVDWGALRTSDIPVFLIFFQFKTFFSWGPATFNCWIMLNIHPNRDSTYTYVPAASRYTSHCNETNPDLDPIGWNNSNLGVSIVMGVAQ